MKKIILLLLAITSLNSYAIDSEFLKNLRLDKLTLTTYHDITFENGILGSKADVNSKCFITRANYVISKRNYPLDAGTKFHVEDISFSKNFFAEGYYMYIQD